jgi:type III pantothenate kinase
MNSFLVIDIGNTRLKWGLYTDTADRHPQLAHGAVFLEQIHLLSDHEWGNLPAPKRIIGCSVAADSVRREVESQLEHWECPIHWVVPGDESMGIINGYDHPTRLGADRWTAMIGARDIALNRQWQGPVLVVMIGTAVTVDALGADGRFLGGLIVPGHGIMLRALEAGTAGLHVPTGNVERFPTNTSDALTSGGNYAITGAIERMHRHLRERSGQTPLTFISGGASWKVAPHLTMAYEFVETLIFDGLLKILQTKK